MYISIGSEYRSQPMTNEIAIARGLEVTVFKKNVLAHKIYESTIERLN